MKFIVDLLETGGYRRIRIYRNRKNKMTLMTKLTNIENDTRQLAQSSTLQSELKSMDDAELIELQNELQELDKTCDRLCDLIDQRIAQLDAQEK